ncbi:hypothetical protein HP593_004496 [Salmonella enterica]|nr:hypothetical protein [Salmonella enterica subsp. enterica serovar Mikawasima]EFP3022235.1 hypothetical protein [Salmonella enterica]EFS4425199.1 hypothetical protein [Salmonella enterica]EGS9054472.1 hypothetical protein [Salmonella enterica]EJP0856976.1 hypothetical protein [Salmonella enterica]
MSNKQDNHAPGEFSEEPKGFVTVTFDKKETNNNKQSGKSSESSPKPSKSPKR